MRVLVVEDNVTMASAIRFILRNMGFARVMESNNGPDAIQILNHHHFDLVIVDWLLPSLSGIAIVQWMRNQAFYQNTPVIMVTVKDQPEDVLIAVEAGVDEYVLKPLDRDVLCRKVMKVIKDRRMAIS